jgi:hypothetical protein
MTLQPATLTELYSEVARRADTPNQKIDVTETSRVSSLLFRVLSEMPSDKMLMLIGHGLQVARTHPAGK